jgi:hypothetical protein
LIRLLVDWGRRARYIFYLVRVTLWWWVSFLRVFYLDEAYQPRCLVLLVLEIVRNSLIEIPFISSRLWSRLCNMSSEAVTMLCLSSTEIMTMSHLVGYTRPLAATGMCKQSKTGSILAIHVGRHFIDLPL